MRSNGHFTTAVGDAPGAALTVFPARPNPFTGTTYFDVGLNEPSDVSIDVYDVAGRRVRAIAPARMPAGARRIAFDGRDDAGHPLPSGVYFCRVEAAGSSRIQKIVLLK
jgi:flagellar hook assembly protein FlgD